MISALTKKGNPAESQEFFYLGLLSEFCDKLTLTSDMLIKLAGDNDAALKLLTSAGVDHRLPVPDHAEILELLSDLAALRLELESEMDMLHYKDQKKAGTAKP